MTGPSEQRRGYFELVFRPSVELVSIVRRFVADSFGELLEDDEATSRLALATHELLENAVKYCVNGEARLSVELRGDGASRRVIVTTGNAASEPNRRAAERCLDALAGAADPFQYYQALLRRSRNAEGSGLGLARVRAEADMTMTHHAEGDHISIRAEAFVAPGAAA